MRDDRVQMLQIIDLDIDRHFPEIGRKRFDDDVVDIGRMIADHGRDRPQGARLVDRGDEKPRREQLMAALLDVPAHIEPTFRLFIEGDKIGRLDRIDGDYIARGQNADDTIARHSATVRGEAHQQIAVRSLKWYRVLFRLAATGDLEDQTRRILHAKPAAFPARTRDNRLA